MRKIRAQLIIAIAVTCFGASVALACGGNFVWQLLDNRAVTLETMPVDTRSFAYAEAHLFPSPNDKLTAKETDYPNQARNDFLAEAVAHAEVEDLASDQAEVVHQMRAEASGDSAFSKGAMLPAAVRLYAAGAVDFHKGNSAKAIRRFHAIFDLPASDRRDREVWAAFMLGRLYGSEGDITKSSRSFELTRRLANSGAPDPLGLGVASFGEEARLHLKRAEALQKSKKMSPQQRQEYGREIAAAVRLYAEQAAHGSTIGIDSLRRVIDEVSDDDAAVAASICDPIVQQLLVTRTLDAAAWASHDPDGYQGSTPTSQISTLVRSVQKCGSGNLIGADRLAAIAYHDGDYQLAHRLAIQTTTPLALWVQARLAMQKGDVGEAAKYYAAASKAFPSSGDTRASDEGAKALLVGENSVLTLSRGEYVDALEQLYPYAANFWGDVAYIAERVLTVDELKTFVDAHKDKPLNPAVSLDDLPGFSSNPNDYGSTEALTQFWFPDGRGPADRLRDLLARRLVRAHRYQEALRYLPPPVGWTNVGSMVPHEALAPMPGTTITRLVIPRDVARLVVSEGPFAMGLPNIAAHINQLQQLLRQIPQQPPADSNRPPFGGPPSRYAPWAMVVKGRRFLMLRPTPEGGTVAYVQALNEAQVAKSEVDRSRAWYTAATLAADFKSGNKIMGTEGPPDNYAEPFLSDSGVGQSDLRADDSFVTDGERHRFNASALKPNLRYHYLFVGVDEAIHAADLLPPRSQAFAAVLCNAASWIADGTSCPVSASDLRRTRLGSEAPVDKSIRKANEWQTGYEPARVDLTCQLYQRYLKEGAVVPWAKYFGRGCPDPDFDSAVHFVQDQKIREARRDARISHHRRVTALKLALILACWGLGTWWFVRHRYA